MNYDPEEECDLIHGLCKLFAEIDVNGDKKLQWSEFTQYVIDAMMQNPTRKSDTMNQKDLLDQAHINDLPRFGESLYMDSCVHDGPVHRVVYYPALDKLMVTEGRTHCVKFISPDLKRKEIVDLYAKDLDVYNKEDRSSRTENTYFVLSATYNEKDQMVFLLGLTVK